jgi:hypothetical protein
MEAIGADGLEDSTFALFPPLIFQDDRFVTTAWHSFCKLGAPRSFTPLHTHTQHMNFTTFSRSRVQAVRTTELGPRSRAAVSVGVSLSACPSPVATLLRQPASSILHEANPPVVPIRSYAV